eukprot:TRINITY_DN2429_c0_g1_i1.p1 TRINITY_DN2429_c0_g1~~TRINITY_DN2429_c0_g1_i1.p1  ORF type:complete len:658 (-),score=54.95 TRINITY_DN2429_c0_g1_i1:24-1997(-)
MPTLELFLLPLTPEEIRFSALRFGPGLTKLKMHNIYCNDDILRALARSSAAQTLRRLNLRYSSITDESRNVWSDLIALESLKISYSSRITQATISSIAQVATLQRIEATDLHLVPDHQVCETLLQEGSLPRLTSLICGGFDIAYSRLLPVLEARSNREHVAKLLFEYSSMSPETVEEISRLFPNLSCPPCSVVSWQTFTDASGHFCSLRELRIQNHLSDFMLLEPRHIEFLSQTCPMLEKLDIMCTIVSSHVRFDSLPMLRKLDLGWLVQSWKEEDAGADNSAASYDEFVRALCNLTRLESLQLHPCGPWTRDHYEWLLESLVNAEDLFVSDGALGPTPNRVTVVNHPRLREAAVDENCVPAFGNLPSVERISGWAQRRVELDALKSLRTAIVPKLKHLTLTVPKIKAENFEYENDQMEETNVVSDLLAVFATVERRLAPRLLQFGLSGGPFGQHIRWIPFQNVYQLTLEDVDLTSAMCERMMSTLKLLNSLSLASCCGIDSYSWIKHPRLMNLTFSGLKPPVDAADADPDSAMIQLSPSTTPCLKEIFIFDFRASVLAIWDLPYLQVCCFAMSWGGPLSFSLESCPNLLEMNTNHIKFSRFTVDGIPRLGLGRIEVCLCPNGVLRWPEYLPQLDPASDEPVDEDGWRHFCLKLGTQ